ncbi:Tubulin-tyrosine ligase/Tubulin polyglutamylase [Trypanosoma melophagium]|uniref:Tubulin-tyrosine ligase/Tubulin polyglutamylase n=1 Tax=Trypanosoma melophagium TaxID=715481 RepID=UPI00351AA46B|nr:Tubulin-tyrosine ligase/Tubulin polyglutamylase [Trypanosoma melophagium]
MKQSCRLRVFHTLPKLGSVSELGREQSQKQQEEEQERQSLVPDLPVYLKPSSSKRRKASFCFSRMSEDNPEYAFKAPALGTAAPLFSITSSSCEYYALRLPLLKAGFKRLPTGVNINIPSNVLWGRSISQNITKDISSYPLSSSALGVTSLSPALSSSLPQKPDSGIQHLNVPRLVCPYQRFNHFPQSHANLGCKWGLTRRLRGALDLHKAAGEKQLLYNFIPRTWAFPDEKETLMKALAEAPPTQRFIWKPARGSCGRGIFTCMGGLKNSMKWKSIATTIENRLLGENSLLNLGSRKYVVQDYIEDPLLIDGRKIDLRLYVAVTSYDPLVVYLHEEGLVRLAVHEYDSGQVLNFDPFRDLTNYSVGKRWNARSKQLREQEEVNSTIDLNPVQQQHQHQECHQQEEEEKLELKKSLKELWEHIDNMYPLPLHIIPSTTLANAPPYRRMSEKVWDDIASVIVKTLLAVKNPLTNALNHSSFPGSFFELYGFDMMLDAKLKPWLVEVNTLPSLASTSPLDYRVKTNIIADLLNLAMIEPFERPVECFDGLGEKARQSSICDPLNAEAAEVVNRWNEDVNSMRAPVEDHEAREELSLRLQDELTYSRGFCRIFPPLSTPHESSLMNEINFLSRNMSLSKADIWALEA